jgi:glycosyltransferase involved in cell wall biosynthesis
MLIYFNIQGSQSGGGPSVFVHKAGTEFARKGHSVTYKRTPNVDVALCIINTGNILRKVGKNTKVVLRIDGIYNKLYNEKFNRAIRPDMTALHNELKRDLPLVNHTVYQSAWSRDRIWDEIVKVDKNYSVINNGVDVKLFKPNNTRAKDKFINLIHVGKMRDAYLMEMLVGTYKEVQKRGHNVKLLLVGTMDGACHRVLNKHMPDQNIKHVGNFLNNQLTNVYNMGDIFLDVRQGASCNNVVAEAQACGLPVVTPSWGGSCEMVKDTETGIVVDGGKWDYDQNYISGLASAVEKIIPSLSEFKTKARIHAVKNLSIETMIDKYLKAFRS